MRKMDRSVWTAALVMMLALALMLPAMAMAETSDTFWGRAVGGVITLTEDVTIEGTLTHDGSSDVKIDLGGYTLKLTKSDNKIVSNKHVTITNGTIDIDGIQNAWEGILRVENGGHLTLDKVIVRADNKINSACGPFRLFENGKLDLLSSSVIIGKEEFEQNAGYVFYCQDGSPTINIVDSKVTVKNGYSGFLYGNINITNSEINMSLRNNGFNSGDDATHALKLVVNNSPIDLESVGNEGKGMGLGAGSTAKFINSANLKIDGFPEGCIQYRSSISFSEANKPLSIDNTSSIELKGAALFINKKLSGEEQNVDPSKLTTYINMGNAQPSVIGGELVLCSHKNTTLITDTAPTCGAPGAGHKKCNQCGLTIGDSVEIPATGNHSYQWVIDKEAAAGVAGQKHEECTVCGDKKAAVEIPALPVPALPQTGDTSNIALYALMLAASMMGILALLRKKESRGA